MKLSTLIKETQLHEAFDSGEKFFEVFENSKNEADRKRNYMIGAQMLSWLETTKDLKNVDTNPAPKTICEFWTKMAFGGVKKQTSGGLILS